MTETRRIIFVGQCTKLVLVTNDEGEIKKDD